MATLQSASPAKDLALTPDEIFDFLGVLLQHNEVKVVEVQKLPISDAGL
jgi:hypothetical protein